MAGRFRAAILGVLAALMVVGCANATAVPWVTYDPAIRVQIADAVTTHDCRSLARLQRSATLTSDAHQRNTGYSNEDLIAFIEAAQRDAGCR